MLDISFFVLTVDLWDELAQHELNLVVHPSSSSQVSTSYGASQDATGTGPGSSWNDRRQSVQDQRSTGSSSQRPQALREPSLSNVLCAPQDGERLPNPGSLARSSVEETDTGTSFSTQQQQQHSRRGSIGHNATGSFTRNLIGSLVASAFKLYDMQDVLGIWFVLQDLSVRTEGSMKEYIP